MTRRYHRTGLGAALGQLLLALVLPAALALPALAQGEPQNDPPIDPQVELDAWRREVAALKHEAFQRLRERRAPILDAAFPTRTRVSVFVDVTLNIFLLESVTLRIDDSPPVRVTFTHEQAEALLGAGLARALRANVAPGRHRVDLHFSGKLRGDGPEDEPITGAIELEFDKGAAAKALILPVQPRAFRANRTLAPAPWDWKNEASDPRLGLVRFLRATGESFRAMIELLDIAGGDPDGPMPAGYYALLAHVYLDFNMLEPAEAALAEYTRHGPTRDVYEDVRLRMAELAYERGHYAKAMARLSASRPYLNDVQLVVWQDIASRVQMAQGDYAQAVKILSGDNALEVLTEVDDASNQDLGMRYNFAISLLRSGDIDRGRTLLDRLGRMETFSPAQSALRDKANVVLGFHFVASGQGATAKEIFMRVPLHGPYSEMALLGLGRAELTAPGTRQQRVVVGDEPPMGAYGIADTESGRLNREDMADYYRPDAFSQIQLQPFRMADLAETEEAARKRALVAWKELAQRDPLAPPVQEALVTIPQVLEKFGAYGVAQSQYREAVAALAAVQQRLTREIEALRSGAVPLPAVAGGDGVVAATELVRRWHQQALAALGPSRWQQEFMASNSFHEAAENLLQLRVLQRILAGPPPPAAAYPVATRGGARAYRAVSELEAALREAAEAELARLQTLAAAALAAQREQLEGFLHAARSGLARLQLTAGPVYAVEESAATTNAFGARR